MSGALKYSKLDPSEFNSEDLKKIELALESNDEDQLRNLFVGLSKTGSFKDAMIKILSTLVEGDSISIASSEEVLTSQQSADFLKVSRPYMNKLLDTEIIPSYKDGKHRRVFFKDLLSYKDKRESGHRGLEELSDHAQKNKLGW